jgi:hypothetical protein
MLSIFLAAPRRPPSKYPNEDKKIIAHHPRTENANLCRITELSCTEDNGSTSESNSDTSSTRTKGGVSSSSQIVVDEGPA